MTLLYLSGRKPTSGRMVAQSDYLSQEGALVRRSQLVFASSGVSLESSDRNCAHS